ncbi:MAG TPA: preprotein translocase subunit SecG [Planctomycetaceae bacterium]|nr:preprotein translocase subunit SecG [Planctomycetaceae bacterium]
MAYLSVTLLMIVGIFLILLVLVQRGRGGGLAGAFGGMGGQSAFGTKAGDVFTRITIVAAVLWVLLAGASIHALRPKDKFPGAQAPPPGLSNTDDDKIPTADGKEPGDDPLKDDNSTKEIEVEPKKTDDAKPDTTEATKPGLELPNPNDPNPDDKKPAEATPESTDKKDNE